MRLIVGAVVAMALTGALQAAECRFETATFAQPEGWTLQFQPVPREAAGNQTASFVLTLKSGATLTGAVQWPNGYSTPLWSVEGPCQPGRREICRFNDDSNDTAYVLTEVGIERLPQQMDGPPPRQVLLPRLGSSIWYSWYRETEFDLDVDPGDVFTFSGCAT